jgi:hypothetical protein
MFSECEKGFHNTASDERAHGMLAKGYDESRAAQFAANNAELVEPRGRHFLSAEKVGSWDTGVWASRRWNEGTTRTS